jgi:hypothetical protein
LAQLGLSHIRPEDVEALDSVEHIAALQQVGRAVAEQDVKESHFERF